MYAMKLLALGAAMALSTFGEADAMKLLGKRGHRNPNRRHQAPAKTTPTPIITKSGGESTKSARSTAGDFAIKAKAAAGAIDLRVASYLKTFKNPGVQAIGKSSFKRKVIVVVLVCLIAFVIFAAATGSTWCTGPMEGTPDELVKRDFNDGTDPEHANGQFMTEYVDLDGNRADFEEVNVYMYDSQSAYLDARDNYAEVGAENFFVGVNDDGRTVVDGANSDMRWAGGRFGGEGIDVNYHRQVLTGWENYATRNMANLHVNAY